MNICRVGWKPIHRGGRNWSIPTTGDHFPGWRIATLCPAAQGVVNQLNNCGKGKLCPASSRLLMLASNYTCQSSQDAMCNYQLSLSTAWRQRAAHGERETENQNISTDAWLKVPSGPMPSHYGRYVIWFGCLRVSPLKKIYWCYFEKKLFKIWSCYLGSDEE